MGRSVTVARIEVLDRDELKEIQQAAKERVTALEQLEKKLSDRELHSAARDVAAVIRVWEGVDGTAGLLDRIADQMSLYEPAFSSNGREPAGQGDLLEGVPPRKEPEQVRPVDLLALRAALILSDHFVTAGPEAFDKLDAEVTADRREVYLGRAPMELLHELPAIEAAAIYQIILRLVIDQRLPADFDEDEQAALQKLATAIATHPATLAPYYEAFGIDAPGVYLPEGEGLDILAEEEWARASTMDLQEAIQRAECDRLQALLAHVVSERAAHAITRDDLRALTFHQFCEILEYCSAVHRSQADKDVDVPARPALLNELEREWELANPPPYQPSPAEKLQEEVLRNTPVSDSFFKDALKQATVWSLTKALEIVAGLDGQKTREKLIRKRLAEIAPDRLEAFNAPGNGPTDESTADVENSADPAESDDLIDF